MRTFVLIITFDTIDGFNSHKILCVLQQFFYCSKTTRMSDYWGNCSVAITYFLLCHPLQLTLCLFTCHASEYYQNSMLTNKYMYLPFYYLLTYFSLVSRHVWIITLSGSNLSVLLSPRQHHKQFSV